MNVTQGLSKIKKWIALYIGAVSLILVPLYIKGSYFGLIELKARVFYIPRSLQFFRLPFWQQLNSFLIEAAAIR